MNRPENWVPMKNMNSPWWRHKTETFSALLAICAGNSPVSGEFPAQSQWRGALVFSLIYAWINGWVNNREAGDLRRYRAHYDVTVMTMMRKGYRRRFSIRENNFIDIYVICFIKIDILYTIYIYIHMFYSFGFSSCGPYANFSVMATLSFRKCPCLTHWDRVTHICVSKLSHYWFR